MVEEDRIHARIAGLARIREQPEYTHSALRQCGSWAYDVLCRTSETKSLEKSSSANLRSWNRPLRFLPLSSNCGMAAHPYDRNPLFQRAEESEEDYLSRTGERQKFFDRHIQWKKQTETSPLPLVPVAGGLRDSGNVCPGAPTEET